MLAAPEALPFITTHDIKMMILVKVLVVLGVCTQRRVALYLLPITVFTVVHTTWCGGRTGEQVRVLTTFRNVNTQSSMEAEILEAVDLIVEVGTADERTAVGDICLLVKQ